MAEMLTLARPYAEAAFKLASGGGDSAAQLSSWADALSRLSAVSAAPEMAAVLGNPVVSAKQLATLVSETAGTLTDQQRNFVSLLADNEKIAALPEVLVHFTALRSKFEDSLEAEITSAFPLSDAQLADIVAVLTSKYSKKVKAHVKVDAALIGGVSIRVGDEVTDVSVRGKLAQLQASLAA
jgi:F-type H+-transporting ATPase subunit delta